MPKTCYVEIDVVALAQSSSRLFWYASDSTLKPGQVCEVQFGKRQSMGVVISCQVSKPKGIAGIKKITKTFEHIPVLPDYLLKTAVWLKTYYAASSYAVWTTLLPSGLRAKARNELTLQSAKKLLSINKLSPEQAKVLKYITVQPKASVLAGVTGSGKTEIYLHAIASVLQQKQSAILLVPEIMLTTQLAERLQQHFKNVLIVHSGLSSVRRKQIWLYCLAKSSQNEPIVVVGARSALWMPLHNLGLIVVDEEHEPSYKQESFLRYSTTHVAGFIAKVKSAKLILGSATPSVTTFFLAKQNKLGLAHLHFRHNSSLPNIKVIDKTTFKGSLSTELVGAVSGALAGGKQSLLFLNRRGSASSMICEDCGHVVRCPNCDISLSMHGDIARLLCHYCGYSSLPPTGCTECSRQLKFVGTGTQKLETEITQNWPEARVTRIDRDNATLEHMQRLYADLQAGDVDIVVGTQMISRGLDIENLSVVGIVDADTSLAIADYTSSERTYQLIAQTAGRAGRRADMGTVIVQTRNPSHYAIAAATTHNYEQFYQQELASRAKYAYPPYVYLLKLWYGNSNVKLAEQHARELFLQLSKNKQVIVLGPAPALQKRQSGKYVWQIIAKAKTRAQLIELASQLPSGWQFELDPINLI